jgi:hypothetical protein
MKTILLKLHRQRWVFLILCAMGAITKSILGSDTLDSVGNLVNVPPFSYVQSDIRVGIFAILTFWIFDLMFDLIVDLIVEEDDKAE